MKISDEAVEAATRAHWDYGIKVTGCGVPWDEARRMHGEALDPALDKQRAALEAAAPYLEPAGDYEPGTRFLVIEIPPAASDEVADEITEKVFKHAAELDEQYEGPWDLFIYRQHNAPPANVPAAPAVPQPVDREALDGLLRKHTIRAFQPEHSSCYCDREWRTHAEHHEHLLTALLGGSVLAGEQVEP